MVENKTAVMSKICKQWEAAAAKGNAEAQYKLGQAYWDGWNVPFPDGQVAVELWKKGASAGHGKSMFKLVSLLNTIQSALPQKQKHNLYNTAISLLEDQVALGKKADPEALTHLATLYFDKNNKEYDVGKARKLRKTARQIYTTAIEKQGADEDLCFHLAKLYNEKECKILGDDGGNNQLSFQYMKMAAEKGCPSAMTYLSEYYNNGWGVSSSCALAYSWALKAAKVGFYLGYDKLAFHYYVGMGVKRNYLKAAQLLSYLHLLGADVFASCYSIGYVLGIMHYEGGYGLKRNYKLAMQYLDQCFPIVAKYRGMVESDMSYEGHRKQESDPFSTMGKMLYMGGYGIERDLTAAINVWSEGNDENMLFGAGPTVGAFLIGIEHYNKLPKKGKNPAEMKKESIRAMSDLGSMLDFAGFCDAYLYTNKYHSKSETRDNIIGMLLKWKDSHHADQFAVYLADGLLRKLGVKEDPISYYFGIGVERDYAKAVEGFRPRAEAGDPFFMFKLGCIYYTGGYGVEKNGKAALEWFEKGSLKDQKRCFFGYIMCVINGVGLDKPASTEEGLKLIFAIIQEGGPHGFSDAVQDGLPWETAQEKADYTYIRHFAQAWGFTRVEPERLHERLDDAVQGLTQIVEDIGETDPFWHYLALSELQRLGQHTRADEDESKSVFSKVKKVLKAKERKPR